MENIENISVKDLLKTNEYRIPIYQRNYAWGIEEMTQLIQDVADYAKDNAGSYYYIGNLIVFPRNESNHQFLETVDGQQRTTTLTIIMCAIRDNKNKHKCDTLWYKSTNISFDHRENSNYTLNTIFKKPQSRFNEDDVNADILNVFNSVWSTIEKVCNDKNLAISDFIKYLLDQVHILRIVVPKETNLNHYFEIMNSRGEQLEQHEIVKAWLMAPLRDNKDQMAAFNLIWEACSNMDKYVQMNFQKNIRCELFENNGSGIRVISFENFAEIISNDNTLDIEAKSLNCLFKDDLLNVKYKKPWLDVKDAESSDSFHSIISFSNFLLHVLKLMRPKDPSVVLDDKRLLNVFKQSLESAMDSRQFSIDFIQNLLDVKLLFDKFIIKRSQDKWILKQLLPQKSNEEQYYYKGTFSKVDNDSIENRKIIMLLSMFHVSAPTQIYKNWLFAALYYIYNEKTTVTSSCYAEFLSNLAKGYMLDRYLADDTSKKSFEEIIFNCYENGDAINSIDNARWGNINIDEYPQIGEHVENFVFNFYDYLLWTDNEDNDFEFTYRTSIEHFYPQHPTDKEQMDYNSLHSFGNLCLISRGVNSKFTNNLPGAKYENFGNSVSVKTFSMKLKEMMNCIKNHIKWDENKISSMESIAKERIISALSD